MTPSELITLAANISLNEDEPDSNQQARLLRYLNRAYFDVYRRTGDLIVTRYASSEDVTITNGSGTLTSEPLRILQVVDKNNDIVLKASDIFEIERYDEDLDDTGDPTHFYMTDGTTINTWPSNSTTIRVRTVSNPTELTISDDATAIKIPVAYQDILLEGLLFYLYQDERDLRSANEIAQAKAIYEEKLGELKRYLLGQPRAKLRTKYVDF